MPAEIIEQESVDPQTVEPLPEDTESMTTEEIIGDFSQPDSTQPPQQEEDNLPEKYRGKSIQEVVGMHQEAEKLIGSQGSEVGQLRKVVDQYITAQLPSQHAQNEEPQEEPVDFFEDPEKAVSRAIEQHPQVRQAAQSAQQFQQQTALAQLESKHPDMKTVLSDQGFGSWVKASPVRMELFQRADQGYDFNAADELISNYKERSAVAQQTLQTETNVRQQAVKAASTGSVTGASTAGSKRIYRRADIIKLMKTDPDRYETLSPEIMQAYAEGRVK